MLFELNHAEEVAVITCDGRIINGTLSGYDQLQNLILQNANERVYPMIENQDDDNDEEGHPIVERVPLGLYVIRGDNVAIISDVIEDVWRKEEEVSGLSPAAASVSDLVTMFRNGQPIKEVSQAII
jgi:U6 snRNA-associated Sm-like protein LSm8